MEWVRWGAVECVLAERAQLPASAVEREPRARQYCRYRAVPGGAQSPSEQSWAARRSELAAHAWRENVIAAKRNAADAVIAWADVEVQAGVVVSERPLPGAPSPLALRTEVKFIGRQAAAGETLRVGLVLSQGGVQLQTRV